jgi:phosphate uptake regulator
MAHDRQSEVDDLYIQAQRILMHDMTEDKQRFVAELGFENHAALPPNKLSRLRELVK